MGLLGKLLDPIGITKNKTVKKILKGPVGAVLDPVNNIYSNAKDSSWKEALKKNLGTNLVIADPATAGARLLAKDPYRFLDYSAYGAGDFISPKYTNKNNKGWSDVVSGLKSFLSGKPGQGGGNKIYDIAGPIMAMYWGGAFASGGSYGPGSGKVLPWSTAQGSGTKTIGGQVLGLGKTGATTGAGTVGGDSTGVSYVQNAAGEWVPSTAAAGSGAAGAGTGAGTSTLAGGAKSMGLGIGDYLNIGSTLLSGYLANKGADANSDALDNATDAQLMMYYQSRADLAPWTVAGGKAVQDYSNLLSKGPGTFKPTEQPGYEYGYNQLAKTYLGAQSARGKRFSGETATGLANQAQDYASTQYDNWLNRYYAKLNSYANLAGLGQTSATTNANNALTTGNNVASNTIQQGQNQADLYSIYAGLGNNASNNYLNYSMYKKLGVA